MNTVDSSSLLARFGRLATAEKKAHLMQVHGSNHEWGEFLLAKPISASFAQLLADDMKFVEAGPLPSELKGNISGGRLE
jgi:hypothetical protein